MTINLEISSEMQEQIMREAELRSATPEQLALEGLRQLLSAENAPSLRTATKSKEARREQERLRTTLENILAKAKTLPPDPLTPIPNYGNIEFGKAVAEKYRAMGLNI